MTLAPKNWSTFQHYKDRKPAWIKLHHALLDDYAFARLPVASRALAPLLWLLASEYENGEITAPLDEIAFRLHMTLDDLCAALGPLVEAKFFIASNNVAICSTSASNLLAASEQVAIPEKETQEQKDGTSPSSVATATDAGALVDIEKSPAMAVQIALALSPKAFDAFWAAYPKRDGANPKVMARKRFLAAIKSGADADSIIAAVKAYGDELRRSGKFGTQYVAQAATWLNEQRWFDYQPVPDDAEKRAALDAFMLSKGLKWIDNKWTKISEAA